MTLFQYLKPLVAQNARTPGSWFRENQRWMQYEQRPKYDKLGSDNNMGDDLE